VVALAIVTAVIALLVGARVATPVRPGLRELRNFYGTLRVGDLPAPDGSGDVRYLTHGGTRHGQQFQDAARRARPTTYYGHPSGIGILLDELAHGPPLRVGVVGLGAGILAAYGRAGDSIRFYEINPQVIDVAQREFTFLGDSAAHTELVCGDARLSLEREESQRFDVLVLDAFSSDAIPVHLLTLQAFELYDRHLVPGGVLALHLTTRYLDLGPLVASMARATDKQAWEITSAADDEQGLLDARWMLLTTNADLLARPSIRSAGQAPRAGASPPKPWRDDYSNLLQVLK
jgi:protein-L-isoaspartate O-methyltransferase